MYPFETRFHELLGLLCECEGSFECEWCERLRRRDEGWPLDRVEFEKEMEEELNRRHFFYIHGFDIDDIPPDLEGEGGEGGVTNNHAGIPCLGSAPAGQEGDPHV